MDSKLSTPTENQAISWCCNGLLGYLAGHVLDKHRLGIGPLGHIFFIGPLEQGIDLGGAAGLDHGDQIFQPDQGQRPDCQGDLGPLVMGAGRADFL